MDQNVINIVNEILKRLIYRLKQLFSVYIKYCTFPTRLYKSGRPERDKKLQQVDYDFTNTNKLF